MPDASMTTAVIKGADLKGLELLYDYTKFHIGVYLTMASAFITIASLRKGDALVLELRRLPVWLAMACFLVAGFAGGVIVSSITQCFGHVQAELPGRCASTFEFLNQRLGPWDFLWFSGKTWTRIEHTAFWFGVLLALASFKPRAPEPDKQKEPLAVKLDGGIEIKRAKNAA